MEASRFGYGIVWVSGTKNPLPRPPLGGPLFNLPGEKGEWKPYDWWVAYRRVGTKLRDHNFLQRTPQEQLQFADEIASAICELIERAGDFVRSKEIEAASQEPKAVAL